MAAACAVAREQCRVRACVQQRAEQRLAVGRLCGQVQRGHALVTNVIDASEAARCALQRLHGELDERVACTKYQGWLLLHPRGHRASGVEGHCRQLTRSLLDSDTAVGACS